MPAWRIDFEVHVEHAGERLLAHECRLDPALGLAGSQWFEFEADPSCRAGEAVDPLFVNEAGRARGEELWMAGCWQPRVRVPGNPAASLPEAVDSVHVLASESWTAAETHGRLGRL